VYNWHRDIVDRSGNVHLAYAQAKLKVATRGGSAKARESGQCFEDYTPNDAVTRGAIDGRDFRNSSTVLNFEWRLTGRNSNRTT
jgi:hypothetical protein